MERDWAAELTKAEANGFTGYCGIKIEQAADGFCRVSCLMEEHHLNPYRRAHGGAIFSLMDTAAGVAGITLRGEERSVVTQSADVHFLRPVKPGMIYAQAKIVKSGRQTALATVDVLDEEGTLYNRGEFELFYIKT